MESGHNSYKQYLVKLSRIRTLQGKDFEVKKIMRFPKGIGMFEEI